MIVVSDASPLNVLVRIGYADVLHQIFGSVIIPPAVASELCHPNTPEPVRQWLLTPPSWLVIRAPSRVDEMIEIDDRGELEAISLALEIEASILLVDDRKARRIAQHRGLAIAGTIAVLELASVRDLLDLEEAFDRLRQTDFRIANRILSDALNRGACRKRNKE